MSGCLEKICMTRCRAICCYNGTGLSEKEAETVTQLVEAHPELFPGVPDEFIVQGPNEYHKEQQVGPRTALREHRYFPPHVETPDGFTNTICVFAGEGGKCMLHAAALKLGRPVEEVKPFECRIFPMVFIEGELLSPVTEEGDVREYPGRTYHMELLSYIPCVRYKPEQVSWDEYVNPREDPRES